MFGPLTVPFGCVMLYNVVKLKEGVSIEVVELILGKLCNVVKNTYWQSFDQHEKSHADATFKAKFDQLAKYASETYEIGYEMLWQGEPEDQLLLNTLGIPTTSNCICTRRADLLTWRLQLHSND